MLIFALIKTLIVKDSKLSVLRIKAGSGALKIKGILIKLDYIAIINFHITIY